MRDSVSARVFLRAFAAVYLLSVLWAWSAAAAEVGVRLESGPERGTVYLAVFDSQHTFGDTREAFKTVVYELDGRESYTIADLPEGEYALMVHFDENGNGVLDRNFIGIPKEPMGFSNGYRPKGPPRYERAKFMLNDKAPAYFDVQLFRPLGKRGQLGVGLGVLGRSAPYRGSSGGVYQFIPAISYNGELIQVLGPNVSFSLAGEDRLRLAGTLSYRMGAYDEEDSDYLQGMGSAESTAMLGLALQSEFPYGIDVAASYSHDMLDRIGGGEGRLQVDKGFEIAEVKVTPKLALNWLSSDLANNDFGVPSAYALPERPAYELGSLMSVEGGIGMFIEVTEEFFVILDVAIELLDDEAAGSPIVDDNHVFKGFSAVTYVF